MKVCANLGLNKNKGHFFVNESSVISLAAIDRPDFIQPAVMVIEHDPAALSDCQHVLGTLGYEYHSATNLGDAIDLLHRVSSIQIILASEQMPHIGGLRVIEELLLRADNGRPVVPIIVTDTLTADFALEALRSKAVDVVVRPFNVDTFATALRRAIGRLREHLDLQRRESLSGIGLQLTRLIASMNEPGGEVSTSGELSDQELNATLQTILSGRSLRMRYFSNRLFADPVWDILLDLMRARLEHQTLSVSSVCIAASVPMTTALRAVKQMTDEGLLRRWPDPKNKRRDLIDLTDTTASYMREYLSVVTRMMARP